MGKAENDELAEKLQALLDLEEGLDDYELKFVEDMSNRVGYVRGKQGIQSRLLSYLTEKQVEYLEKLYERRC